MPEIRLFNTLANEKTVFVPVDPGHVRLYACGPTVYNYAHIGNARMAVVFDLLVRVLRRLYPKVTYISNITDVDDKIIAAAKKTSEKIDVITRKYEGIYNEDMAALGCTPPDIQPRATGHIPEMIAQVGQLIARGHAYEAEGHVMFNVPSYPAYGRLSNRNRDDQIAGARVEVAPYKKDPADFILWKPSTPDQPGWESPWGRGRVDLVVDVGDVARVGDAGVAPAQHAREHVEHHCRAEVSDVREGVDRRAADVHRHPPRIERLEDFLAPA